MCCCAVRRSRWLNRRRRSRRSPHMRDSRFLLAPIATAVLSACAVGPDYHAPESRAAEKFENTDAPYSTGVEASEKGVAPFWQTFQDPTLDRLVEDAATSNY